MAKEVEVFQDFTSTVFLYDYSINIALLLLIMFMYLAPPQANTVCISFTFINDCHNFPVLSTFKTKKFIVAKFFFKSQT